MTSFVEKLPTILILAGMVGTFLSLRSLAPSTRVRWWTYAWGLVFVHFLVQAFETHAGISEMIVETIDLSALELSGIAFVISLMLSVEDRASRMGLLVMLGVPTVFHAAAITIGWNAPRTLAAALGVIFFGGAILPLLGRAESRRFHYTVAAILAATGTGAIYGQLHGSADFGVNAILTLSFGISGVLFWRCYRRFSPGVISAAAGFLSWGAVFPVAALLAKYAPGAHINGELWNVPKYFVAFGMVLTLLEDKSRIIDRARSRDQAENRLLERFSQVTSRLLAGNDPAALCDEIASAITDAGSFRRAAMLLLGEDRELHLAGSNGFLEGEVTRLRQSTAGWTIERLNELCKNGERLGHNSYCSSEDGEKVMIPLVSGRGSYLGCLWLSEPKKQWGLHPTEMAKLEMLASDLAVTIENSRLHHQLVRSEKLASLGQLVAGVAHELNNPLTGIIGYAELLGDEVEQESAKKRLQKLGVEARRMKRIVDGLLRFARQNNPAERSAHVASALHDVIQLREYYLRKAGIHIDVRADSLLPAVAIGEDELKQVLLNILSNAIDAVEESAQREICIRASKRGDSIMVQFEDSGPGFHDVNRAFDPFFTTKLVGKGTGLGLSICYGIMQECGGEIALTNRQPYGATVTMEFPLASQPVMALKAS
ncbi:MAG: ATP-binding protein [Candidatus Acidiferrales bacterium]